MEDETLATYSNEEIIAVNQDSVPVCPRAPARIRFARA